jgi:hypothetical protein
MTSALASKQIPKTTRLNSSVILDASFDFDDMSISKHHGVILEIKGFIDEVFPRIYRELQFGSSPRIET